MVNNKPKAKLTEQIKLMVDETMLDDLKHAAFEADRSVSDYIRHIVAMHLYGHARSLSRRPLSARD